MDERYANPYAAPPPLSDTPPPPIARKNPAFGPTAVPRVFGILSIIFGSIGVAGAALFIAILAVIRTSKAEAIPLLAFALLSGFLLLSVALIVIGVGQRRYRTQARQATLYWCFAALLLLVSATIVIALMGREGVMRRGSDIAGLIISLWFYLADYPVLLLIIFTRRRVVEAMTR
jgi:hypothetical protein